MNDAIAQKKLPGAVVVIGHDGKVVFHQAYGNRKVAGEVSPDGSTSAEPMTEDTIFDMASLTKCLATATSMMQLYEQGKYQFDDPVAKYLPEFGVNGKDKITIRDLLTHYSGLPPDVSIKDPWGLAAPDKAEGIKRAMESKLDNPPGTKFVYSDINFITLGALVEKLQRTAAGCSRTGAHLHPVEDDQHCRIIHLQKSMRATRCLRSSNCNVCTISCREEMSHKWMRRARHLEYGRYPEHRSNRP